MFTGSVNNYVKYNTLYSERVAVFLLCSGSIIRHHVVLCNLCMCWFVIKISINVQAVTLSHPP